MVRKQEIPLVLFMAFTLVYATIGNPDDATWSMWYFIVNYLTLLWLFKSHKNKVIRLTGISLSVSILLSIAAKYIVPIVLPSWGFKIQRVYTAIPFTICLIGLIKLEMRNASLVRKANKR